MKLLHRMLLLAGTGLVCTSLSGCLIAGFNSNGSSFLWPGGLGLIVMLGLLLWFLLRTR